jgi:hypothetical protein
MNKETIGSTGTVPGHRALVCDEMELSQVNFDRFFARIKKSQNGCWEWSGVRWKNGYGRIMVNGKRRKAHRVSFLIHNGFLTKKQLVCHTCDNPCCVNPEHLFLGSVKDNSDDKISKMRHGIGSRNGRSVLSQDQVLMLRSMRVIDVIDSLKEIADRLSVSTVSVRNVIKRKTWKHI